MTIGEKLRAARARANLTQEQAAEALRVSRQTVSSWENDRSYPDLANTITLSNLYGLTLDELLKEDTKMLRHLTDSADVAKSQRTLSRRLLVLIYLLVWGFSAAFFWLAAGPTDAMGYGLVFLWLVIPVTTAAVSFFIGKDPGWQSARWLMLLFFGVMYMLLPYVTYSWANTLSAGKLHLPEPGAMLPGILLSALGMGAGALARRLEDKRGSGGEKRRSGDAPGT